MVPCHQTSRTSTPKWRYEPVLFVGRPNWNERPTLTYDRRKGYIEETTKIRLGSNQHFRRGLRLYRASATDYNHYWTTARRILLKMPRSIAAVLNFNCQTRESSHYDRLNRKNLQHKSSNPHYTAGRKRGRDWRSQQQRGRRPAYQTETNNSGT